MKLLAFDTSTEAMSIAVGVTVGAAVPGADMRVWQRSAPGGAQASATLIPAILSLLAEAGIALRELDAIAFGCGPGSFTGLRTACSVAQGLAFGAGVPVLPVDSLMAVAEEARSQSGATRVSAVLDARMDEVYAAHFSFDGGRWRMDGDFVLVAPQALQLPGDEGRVLAGNAFAACGERLPAAAARIDALPTAAAMLRLAPALLAAGAAVAADQALPHYIRDKVAKTTDERAAERAAKDAAAALSSAKP